MVRQRRRRGARALQPLRAQGHAAGQRRVRQHRPVLPLPVPRLDLHASTARRCAMPLARAATRARGCSECESGQRHAGAVRQSRCTATSSSCKLGRRRPRLRRATSARCCASIDNLVDRSPVGRLRDRGRRACATSSAATGRSTSRTSTTRCIRCRRTSRPRGGRSALWQGQRGRRAQADGDGADPALRRRLRLLRPDGRPRLRRTATACSARNFSIHSGYAQLPEYEAAMRAAHGDERAAEILQRSPQNALCYPEPGASRARRRRSA